MSQTSRRIDTITQRITSAGQHVALCMEFVGKDPFTGAQLWRMTLAIDGIVMGGLTVDDLEKISAAMMARAAAEPERQTR